MDIINYEGHLIAVFDGDIIPNSPDGFVIYGNLGEHMLAYIDNDGKIITLNSIPFANLILTIEALKLLLDEYSSGIDEQFYQLDEMLFDPPANTLRTDKLVSSVITVQ